MIKNAFTIIAHYFRGLFAIGYNNQYRQGTAIKRIRKPGKPVQPGNKLRKKVIARTLTKCNP